MSEEASDECVLRYSVTENCFVTNKLRGNAAKTMGKYIRDHFVLTPEEAFYIQKSQNGIRLYFDSDLEIDEILAPHFADTPTSLLVMMRFYS